MTFFGDKTGRYIAMGLAALLLAAAMIPLAFPSQLADFRCCLTLAQQPERHWKNLSWQARMREMNTASRQLWETPPPDLVGSRSLASSQRLPEWFREIKNQGPTITVGVPGPRGPVFIIQPRQGRSWNLPVGGIPGIAPVWSSKSAKLAYVRLDRLWISNENGTKMADVAKLPRLGHGIRILWSCDGTRIAVGNESDGWYEVDLAFIKDGIKS